MNIKGLYIFVYAIISIIAIIYITTSPLALGIGKGFLAPEGHEYWFSLKSIPYSKFLTFGLIISVLLLLILAIMYIIRKNDSYISFGYAITTLLYTILAVMINISIIQFADENAMTVVERGTAWHALLIMMGVNTAQFGVSFIIRGKRTIELD